MRETYGRFVILAFPRLSRLRQLFVCLDRSRQTRQRSRDIFCKQGTGHGATMPLYGSGHPGNNPVLPLRVVSRFLESYQIVIYKRPDADR